MNSSIASQPSLTPPALKTADEFFWLSRLDEDLPRASILPDFKRGASATRVYRQLAFSLDPDIVRILKSLDPARGVSDLVLCTSLMALLLSKYHQSDELVMGLQFSTPGLGHQHVLPFRIMCSREATMLTLVSAVADEIAPLAERAAPSPTQMARVLGVEQSVARYPFFDLAVAVGGANTHIDFNAYPLDIGVVFETTAGHIRGRVEYAAELYEPSSIERLVGHFLRAAGEVARQPTLRLGEVDVLSQDEKHLIQHQFQGPQLDFPLTRTLHGLFEDQVRRTPEATAVLHGGARLSYSELNARANRVAHSLLSQGLKSGSFVGILLGRSPDFLTAMLGVFKAGGAYVPLDPTYPRDRIGYMLADCDAEFVISDAATIVRFPGALQRGECVQHVLSLRGSLGAGALARASIRVTGPEQLTSASTTNPDLPLGGSDRAYMIYTSGSTGQPKGAICRHDGALNHLYGELHGIGVANDFRFLQTAASSSDISVWQFMAPLLFGGATVIADYEVVIDPAQLLAALQEQAITVAEPVPVVLRALLDHVSELTPQARSLPALRCMMCTGEALSSELVDRWLALYPDIPIANTYGPTETSDDVTLLVLRQPISHRWAVTPIGPPLPNLSIFILDRDLQLVPIGAPGEICIAGVGVGEGYWRQPEKTSAAFIPCPVPTAAGRTTYRTGDLGRWLPDGSIEFLGRVDQQVKVRGFRVEPGEVEEVMMRHRAVREAAVVTVQDAAGNNQLIGYFVSHGSGQVTPAELRQQMKASLADHMIPARLVSISAIPLTPLGKVDRRALSQMEFGRHADAESYAPPRNPVESALASAFAKVLRRSRVGIHENFFELGGDSILTLHVIAELRKVGIRVVPREFFLYPTIAELAEAREAAQPDAGATLATPSPESSQPRWDSLQLRQQIASAFSQVDDVYPLGATQRGIYFHSILAPRSSGGYIEQVAFDLTGELDEDLFCMAWQHVVNTTPVLRTAIIRRGVPQPVQAVLPSAALLPDRQDWRALSAPDQHSRFTELEITERANGFDVKRAPLIRVSLVRLADIRWRVLWTYHHIILDGWSEPLVLGAVFRAYSALSSGSELPPEPFPKYRDFIAWSESLEVTATERFWREQLADFTNPVSIRDDSPAIQPPANLEISHGWHEGRVSEAQSRQTDEFCRRHKLTLGTLLQGAWALMLHRRSGASDVVFGSVASGRQCDFLGVENVRGLLVVTQPTRSRVVNDATASSWLRLLQLHMAELREYEHTPLALIQQWCEPSIGKRALFDSIVVIGNYSGSDLSSCAPPGLTLSNVSYSTQPLYALTLFVVPGPTLCVQLVYDKRRYASETVRQLLADYLTLLSVIAEKPEQRLGGLLAAS